MKAVKGLTSNHHRHLQSTSQTKLYKKQLYILASKIQIFW